MERAPVLDHLPDFQIGKSIYLPDGSQAYVQELDPIPPLIQTDEEVPNHEADHVVVGVENGTPVVLATIVPNAANGSLGETHFSRPDAVAAAAPHARGRRGTGYDMHIVAALGVSESSAMATASRILSANQHKVDEVAAELAEKKTLNRWEILEAMDRADRRLEKEKGREVIIFISRPDKSQLSAKSTARSESFAMPEELANQLIEEPQAA